MGRGSRRNECSPGNLEVTVGERGRMFERPIGERQVFHRKQKGIGGDPNQVGRNLGRPSVISELVDQFRMTQSMRPTYSEEDRRKIKNCKGPAIKGPWYLYIFRGYFRGTGTRVG